MKARQLTAFAAVGLFAAFTPHTRTPSSYAVIVGISDYANFGPEIGGDLPGARNDARDFRNVLIAQKGFEAANIHMVLDQEATRERIVSELGTWLPSVVKPGDLVVFYFAGHGSQMWDTNGDEEDGLDETICPTDVVKGDTRNDISDDELNTLLKGVPTDNLVVVLDNCHAGSGTRAVTPFARPRSLDRTASVDVPKPATATAGTPVTNAEMDAAPASVLEIAAAQADEVAVDAEWPGEGGAPSTHNGAFTRSFVRNLWQAPAASYSEIFERTVEDMKRERFAQRPNLDAGERKNRVAQPAFAAFGVKAGTEESLVPVVDAGAQGVVLGGGAAAGITSGSTYKAGDATLRVTRVEDDRAFASAIGGTVKSGDRARLIGYAAPPAELKISVAGLSAATRAQLTQQLKSAPGIALVAGARDFAHLLVRPKDNEYAIIGLDGATRHLAAQPADVAALLVQEAGAHQLAALENPAQAFALDFQFSNDRKNFRVGDAVEFRARSGRDGYLTIVDLGTDGKVVVIYPSEQGQDHRIAAGQEFVLPTGDIAFEAQLPSGRGIVRAFVTPEPLDLPFSQGEATQAPLVGQALRKAIGATSTAIPVNNWATAAIVYSITK
ncbi:MAG: caspase family protein [Gemmatimonadota bacterium]